MLGLLRKYVFATDHEAIGLQYGFTSLFGAMHGTIMVVLGVLPLQIGQKTGDRRQETEA